MSKFCKDCKHIKLPSVDMDSFEFARCKFGDHAEKTDLVAGAIAEVALPYCEIERSMGGVGRCGIEGKNFEPAEVMINDVNDVGVGNE